MKYKEHHRVASFPIDQWKEVVTLFKNWKDRSIKGQRKGQVKQTMFIGQSVSPYGIQLLKKLNGESLTYHEFMLEKKVREVALYVIICDMINTNEYISLIMWMIVTM